MKDPTPRMLEVLRALHKAHKGTIIGYPMTPNEIARACGFQRGQDANKHSHNGRCMAPAQRVIFPLIGLSSRGLIGHARRRDRLSGTAYILTGRGLEFCREHHL